MERVRELAEKLSATPVQVALAWLLAQGDDVAPIPGTKRKEYLEENAAAADIELTAEQLETLEEIFPPGAVAGERYPAEGMASVEL